jgi:hypothetical protein
MPIGPWLKTPGGPRLGFMPPPPWLNMMRLAMPGPTSRGCGMVRWGCVQEGGGGGGYLDEASFLRNFLEVVANVVTVAGTSAVLRRKGKKTEGEHGAC